MSQVQILPALLLLVHQSADAFLHDSVDFQLLEGTLVLPTRGESL